MLRIIFLTHLLVFMTKKLEVFANQSVMKLCESVLVLFKTRIKSDLLKHETAKNER